MRRMRRSLIAFLVGLSSLTVLAQQPAPRFTAEANLVIVPTVVTDNKGAFVSGLAQTDFQVFEDGKPVAIETFVPANAPNAADGSRFIVLVLDNVTTPPEIAHRVRDIAKRFTRRMGPSDSVAAISLRGGKWSGVTTRAAADAAIDRFQPAFGDTIRSPAEDASSGLEAIASLSKQLAALPHRRKLLVFIGAAGMFSPLEPSAFADRGPSRSEQWFEAVQATGQHNFSIYVIDPQGQGGDGLDDAEGFAVETGGYAWTVNNFNVAVDRIWQEAATYYLLGYAAPINDHKIHKIEVRVGKPGVTTRSRKARG
jgi:VWFA-related protein